MGIMRDLFIDEYERLYSEAEEAGGPINEEKICELADEASKDRFFAMCDAVKDRAKYGH